jgi:hypothetical protein
MELNDITKIWIRAYKQAWILPSASDGSPMILSKKNGGRNCPDATEVWIRAAIDVLDQCICLPGEISMITVSYLHRLCNAHGCHALNQLQHLFRVGEIAESTTELLLLRLDEHGMELSSPWSHPPGQSINEVLWPYILNAWLTKERWAGCTELDEDVQLKWKTAKLCLQACKKLGSAKTPILTVSQLYNSHGQWSPFAVCICQLSREEHTALINCLSAATVSGRAESQAPFTARVRASLSSPAAALEADTIHHTTRRRKTQKSSRRIESSVGNTIRGKHSQLITSRATVTTSRQLRFQPDLNVGGCRGSERAGPPRGGDSERPLGDSSRPAGHGPVTVRADGHGPAGAPTRTQQSQPAGDSQARRACVGRGGPGVGRPRSRRRPGGGRLERGGRSASRAVRAGRAPPPGACARAPQMCARRRAGAPR